ncbi:MAG TPA: SRPBCC domain-containing protein [Saprospirales bacterium]|nr:SRPBCC domain-containing protein [Saprospirales bacterium]HRQ29709.1 SRPBCC domain-containing protein [Saprospiraceae bacterium]
MQRLFLLFIFILTMQMLSAQAVMKITDKKIEKTTIVQEPVSKVYWRWTTHEGLKSFFGENNQIECVPGGPFEIYFMMNAPEGLRGSEGCKVLSCLPDQMISFSWNAPPQFMEVRQHAYKTWVVVLFQPIDDQQTEVKLIHLGWPEDTRWDPVYNYFNKAWETVLKWLEEAEKKQ